MQIRYRAAALSDIEEIARYTKREWGKDQARRYLSEMRETASSLSDFPSRNPLLQSKHGDFRKAASGEHFIFYLVEPDAIDVVRVLHKSMDVDEILG